MLKEEEVEEGEEEVQPFTTSSDEIPPEMLRLIFQKLDPSEALFLRYACRSWKENIECMFVNNRHVLIYFEEGLEKDDLARRFFATNLKPFKMFQIEAEAYPNEDFSIGYDSTVSEVFLQRITNMFPHMEHLIVDTVLDEESANALIRFLPTWTKLRTFAVFRASNLPRGHQEALLNAIRRCPTIRRLGITDLGRHWWRHLPLDDIESFAYESQEDNSTEVIRQMTRNTFILWTRIASLSPKSVKNWVNVSRRFVEELEMLHIGDIYDRDNSDRAYVNVSSFINLYVLRIEFEWSAIAEVPNSYTYSTLDPKIFRTMTGLLNLRKLELISFKLDINAINNYNLLPLERITQLKLTRFHARDNGVFDVVGFCTIFSRLFPRLEKLSLVVIYRGDGEAIEQCYKRYFTHLKEFKFTVFVPAKRDNYIAYYELYPYDKY
ncbi:hypothetical protein TYRP_012507 [Tyrophagus putrescentiae]|nr:hypothetical protein TYRP_012507 [Tyrophagus putrescentiae]